MKKIISIVVFIFAFSVIGQAIIRVGIFDGYGGAETCKMEAFESIKLDKEMSVSMLTSSDISNGGLDSLDVLIIPGGGGSRQYLNLGAANRKRIKDFVKSGKGAVGICAGAYLFSDTPDYACMAVNGACAIDLEHDNRGHGVAKFILSDEGKRLFPEIAQRDTSYVVYYEGPVFVKSKQGEGFKTFGQMESDVHEEGDAPKDMTNNRPFFIGSNYGKGRIFSTVGHPEATPGMRWMIPRIVRWTLKREQIPYSKNAVRPALFNKEILFSKAMLKREKGYYETLLYGTPEEKVKALDWLEAHVSWDAKRWVQGLLYDKDARVRARAALYIGNSEFTHYLPDLKAAHKNEQHPLTKAIMERAITVLENL